MRRFPRSRRHPHFSIDTLPAALAAAGIDYQWMEALGGRRPRVAGSPHTAWRVAAFAGYADYMDTPGFAAAAARLVQLAADRPTAVMCAEALPFQCHRRLIADWLTVRGIEVKDVLTPKRAERHELPEFARVVGDRVLYDGGQLGLL